MNKIKIKAPFYDKYVIKTFRAKNIDIYNIEYDEDGTIYTIDEKDFDSIDQDTFKIVSYRGIKQFISKLYTYRHFIISVIISLTLLIFASQVVIDVKVIHSDKDVRSLIENELYGLGIKAFTMKKSFSELQDIKAQIKEDYPDDIEWLEIVDDGMRYIIRVEERIITDKEKARPYCNVISKRDAVILSSVASKGQSVVGTNDFVKKGDILISGSIKFNEATKAHTCAEGTVYGNTWYRVSVSIPLEYEEKKYTGKKKYNLGIENGSVYTRIFKIHYEDYDVEKTRLLHLGSFSLYKEKVLETKTEKGRYTDEEALKEAKKKARENLQVKLDDEAVILNEKVLQSEIYDSIISVDIFYSVKEIISERVEATIPEEEGVEGDVQSTE